MAKGKYDHLNQSGSALSIIKRKKWVFTTIGVIFIVCAIAIPVGVVFGTKDNSSDNREISSSLNVKSLKPLPKWDFKSNKILGLNLGNWLVLERWMAEDWFVKQAGANVWDEWGLTSTLGSKASSVLEEHWSNWITEDDVESAFKAGINTFRVPMGFWMWIPTVSTEPYVTKGQLAHFERLCAYAYARKMYIIIDLHGLPGSQNGEQQSGHNTTTPTFYQAAQQARADRTVKAVVDWVAQSPYYSIISAIEVVNEPRPYTDEQRAMLMAYYERSYATIQKLGSKAPAMFFADGFVPGDKLAFWWDFAAARKTDPPSLLFTDHPYPGYFPAQNNSADILKQTCVKASQYQNFPVPTTITEWSLRTGIQNSAFEKQYYTAQMSAWSWSAGSCFWSIRAMDSKIALLADPIAQYQWSFQSLLERGSIPTPRSKNQTTEEFLSQLGSPCGSAKKLNVDASIPETDAAKIALASSEAAKKLIDGINANIADAAKSLG